MERNNNKQRNKVIRQVKLHVPTCSKPHVRIIISDLTCIKAWVNERACNGEYTDILVIVTRM